MNNEFAFYPHQESDPEIKALALKLRTFCAKNRVAIVLPTADQRPRACREADQTFVWRLPPPPPGAEVRMQIMKARP